MKKALLFVTTLCLVFGAMAAGLFAQQTTGTISGTVRDETGGVLPGVSVTAVNTGTSATRTVISDDEGRYSLRELSPGEYELRAELAGFQTAVLQDIELSMAQNAVVGVTMRVGEISEQIFVSAEVSLVDTTTATVSNLVDSKQVRDLPLNGRDFIQLASLQEGVVTPPAARRTVNGDMGVKISVNGARTYDNAILLDGTDIKNQYGTTPGSVSGSLLGVDTIREFKVITSAYSAEYGRFTGAVVSAVTRSGTNELHGTLFEFHRNSALDARNFFDRDPLNPGVRSDVPPFKRNQFGFTLGGPIVKDQTFFFGSYEGFRERLTTTGISNFPNAAAHQGIVPNVRFRGRFICGPPFGVNGRPASPTCNVGVDPRMQPYVDLMPLPNGPDNGDGTGKVFFDNNEPTNTDVFVGKVDHKFGENDDFFVRYTFDDGDFNFVQEGTIYGFSELSRNQYLTLEEKHVFSPTLLNEVRVAFNRNASASEEVPLVSIPEELFFVDAERQKATGFTPGMGLLFCRGCGINQFGTSTRSPQHHAHNVFQYMDNVVWTRGNHSLKMGASWSRFQYNLANTARMQGSYQYDALHTMLQAEFTDFTMFWGTEAGEIQPMGFRQNLIGIFLQDDYQVRSNLTLNLGLRYEFITNPTEVEGRTGNLDNAPFGDKTREGGGFFSRNPSLKNFSPRIGFAWDPSGEGKFSVRGGVGIFHQQILSWCCTSAFFRSTPFGIRASVTDDRPSDIPLLEAFPDTYTLLTPQSEGIQKPALFVVSEPSQPYQMQWSLTLQRELFGDMAVTATYSGSRAVKLPRVADVNRPLGIRGEDGLWRYNCDSTSRGTRCVQDPENARINLNFDGITDRRWDGTSDYHGLRMGLRKRFSAGHMFQVSYNWQKAIDEGSSIAGSPRESFNDAWLAANWQDRHSDRGVAAFSLEHAFSANWAVELPFGPGRRFGADTGGVLGQVIGGWQINGIVQLSTGAPQNLEGNPARTCSVCSNITANIKPGETFPKSEDPTGWFIPGDIMKTITDEEFPFNQPELGRFGNLGRNAGEGPGAATLDLSLLKSFILTEEAQVQFRAEFFNILNRANFQGPVRSRATHSRGGTITRTFGELTETATTSRQIQLALKIVF